MTRAPETPGCGGEPRVTPQGFIIDEGDDGGWKSVLLARTGLPPDGSRQRLLGFGNPEPAVRAMLETGGELFGVVADCAHLGVQTAGDFGNGAPTFANGLWLGGWPLKVAVGETAPPEYSNVLLLKYCQGTLRQLIATPDVWTGPELAGTDVGALSQWMQDYCDAACRKAEGDSFYKPFADIVDDEGFNGILVLRPSVDLGALPEEMAALPSWLGWGPLHAHHCGVSTGDPRYPIFFGAIDSGADAAGEPGPLSVSRFRALFRYSSLAELEFSLATCPTGMAASEPAPLTGGYAVEQGKRRYSFEPVAEQYALDRPADPPRPLGEWLMGIEPLLTGWFGPAAGAGGVFQIRLTYEYPLSPGGPSTVLPVLLVPPAPVGDAAEMLRSVARQAESWLAETAPPATGARLSLAASVESDPGCDGLLRARLPAFTVSRDRISGS